MLENYNTPILAVAVAVWIYIVFFSPTKESSRQYNLESIPRIQTSHLPNAISAKHNIDVVCDRIYDIPLPNPKLGDKNLQQVHVVNDVFTSDECDWIIQATENFTSQFGWYKKRHDQYPATDVPLQDIPQLGFVQKRIFDKILPAYGDLYAGIEVAQLVPFDIFINKYTPSGQAGLEKHHDQGEFSFITVLNRDFVGGGTEFTALQPPLHVNAPVGSTVIFCGQNEHSGVNIQSGIRYVIAGFLFYGSRHACPIRYCDRCNHLLGGNRCAKIGDCESIHHNITDWNNFESTSIVLPNRGK